MKIKYHEGTSFDGLGENHKLNVTNHKNQTLSLLPLMRNHPQAHHSCKLRPRIHKFGRAAGLKACDSVKRMNKKQAAENHGDHVGLSQPGGRAGRRGGRP
jgi:hypothetical protein